VRGGGCEGVGVGGRVGGGGGGGGGGGRGPLVETYFFTLSNGALRLL